MLDNITLLENLTPEQFAKHIVQEAEPEHHRLQFEHKRNPKIKHTRNAKKPSCLDLRTINSAQNDDYWHQWKMEKKVQYPRVKLPPKPSSPVVPPESKPLPTFVVTSMGETRVFGGRTRRGRPTVEKWLNIGSDERVAMAFKHDGFVVRKIECSNPYWEARMK